MTTTRGPGSDVGHGGPAASSGSGINAILLGLAGLVAVLLARHAESLRTLNDGWLLRWADKLGWVKAPPSGSTDEVRAPVLLSYTDETALQVLLGFGIYLGIAALLLAALASRRREDSLYVGAGLVCGSLALVAAHFWAGMAAMGIGAVLVMAVRRA